MPNISAPPHTTVPDSLLGITSSRSRLLLAIVAMLVTVVGCSTMGGPPAQSATPSPTTATGVLTPPPASASPSASPDPSDESFEASPVQSADEALAAVIDEYPQFEGYPLRPGREPGESPGPVFGGDVVGQSRWVIARDVAAGIELTFVTGSGDCPAGCIEHAYDTYLVEPNGAVRFICSEGDAPSADAPDPIGRSADLLFEPCPDVPR